MSKKEDKVSKRFMIINIILCSVLFLLAIIGIVVFANRKPEVIEKETDGGIVTLDYTTATNSFGIMGAKKTSDTVGEKLSAEGTCFDFSVDINLETSFKLEYEISVVKDEKFSTIPDEDIRIYLEKEDSGTYTRVFGPAEFQPLKEKTNIGSEVGSMVISKVKKINTGSDHYRLRMWLSDSSTLETGNYSVDVLINAVSK